MKDNLNKMFETLHHEFDVETPNAGHENRFLEKLKAQNQAPQVAEVTNKRNFWKPFLGIAASLALIVTLGLGLNKTEEVKDLASISPELAETQSFFSNTINTELEKLKLEQTPETKQLIDDALLRLTTLEKEYENLKNNLTESGDDKRVIYAMIANFQNRIDVLNNALQQIEQVKSLKNNNYETTI